MSAKDNTDTQKAQVLAKIAAIKRGPNPREELIALQARFEELHAIYRQKAPQLEQMLELLGAHPDRVAQELGEFPAWVETQIQLALAEVSK